MSRIGRRPIPLDGVEFSMTGDVVTLKGGRGEATYRLPQGITARQEGAVLHISRSDDSKEQRTLHGTTRAEINNRVIGVSKGHSITLIVQGKGYTAEVKPKVIDMQIGFSHRVVVAIPEGITVGVKPGQNGFTVTVTGNDKHLVGSFASTLYKLRKVEPYNLIGFRYSNQNVKRKAAKSVAG